MKTSAFPEAAALTGYELIGVVQGYYTPTTVQSTVLNVSGVRSSYPAVRLGSGAYTDGFSSIAIGGGESLAVGSTSTMAIGSETIVSASLGVSVGAPSYVTGSYPVSVGGYNFCPGGPAGFTMLGAGNEGSSTAGYSTTLGVGNIQDAPLQVAIGHNIENDNAETRGSVFIGADFTTLVPEVSVLIGYSNKSYGPWCVAIGNQYTKTTFRGVSIGYRTGFGGVEYGNAGEASIAIGTNVYIPVGPTVGIGYDCLSVYNGVALGSCLASNESVAIGHSCDVNGDDAVGIGHSLSAANNATAVGSYNCNAYQHYGMVFGSASDPAIGGCFVNAGMPTSSVLSPVVLQQKLIGQTICAKDAWAAWGDGSYLATVTYDTSGAIGNNYVLNVAENGADESLATSLDGDTFSILLATNDPSTNTLVNILGLFPSNGFSFSYTDGFDDTVISFIFTEDFANGADGGPTTVVLTADGNSPSSTNVPAIYTNSLATLTGIVVATTPTLYDNAGDAANFTLAPVMVLRQSGGGYSFIGTPAFTMTSHTAGAAGWEVPVLSISDDNTQLLITVTNTVADVNWMAHLTFEASKDASPP